MEITEVFCVYDGPSTYTGERIRAYVYPHENDKTNVCAGLVVAPAKTTNYFDARRSGDDYHVCGNCEYSSRAAGGNGRCYVGNGSRIGLSLKHVLTAGAPLEASSDRDELNYFLKRQRFTRLRSAVWGDAAALPVDAWQLIEQSCADRDIDILGYTHGYATIGYGRIGHLRNTHVASVSSLAAADTALANGWRYFRSSRQIGERPRSKLEFHCPASAERGKKVQCSECMACGSIGNEQERRSGFVYEHDTANTHAFKRYVQELSISKDARLTSIGA